MMVHAMGEWVSFLVVALGQESGSWWELVGTGENKARAFSSQQRKASPDANNSERACMCRFEELRRAATVAIVLSVTASSVDPRYCQDRVE